MQSFREVSFDYLTKNIDDRFRLLRTDLIILVTIFDHSFVGDNDMFDALQWFQFDKVGGKITMFVNVLTNKKATKMLTRSFMSQICHRHKLSPTSVTNIDVN